MPYNLIHSYQKIQKKDFVLSGTSALSDLLNLSIIRVFGGVSAILNHQIKNLRKYSKDVDDLKCSKSQCIIVEIFFVIDTSAKLSNGKTTDQSLRTGNRGEIQTRTDFIPEIDVCQTLTLSLLSFITLKDLNCFKKI